MNATFTATAALHCLAALLLAPPAGAKPVTHKPAAHHPAPAAAPSPAVAIVREYLAAHAGGQVGRAYALGREHLNYRLSWRSMRSK